MRSLLVYILAALCVAVAFARQESFCEKAVPRRGRRLGGPAYYDFGGAVPGVVDIMDTKFFGKVLSYPSFRVLGQLEDKMPVSELHIPTATYIFEQPEDFVGSFTGSVEDGKFTLKWANGGVVVGYSGVPYDFDIKGESIIRYED